MLRLQDNPPQIWPPGLFEAPRAAGGRWIAAYCRPRQEKLLARELERKEVAYFLPLVVRQVSGGGRRRKNLLPLFPSYLFFYGDDEARLKVLKTERIVRLVEPESAAQPQFDRELATIETALRLAPDSIELYPRLVQGTLAVITAGPLRGLEGVVIQAENRRKVWLGVSALGAGVTVEIHADLVEPWGGR